MFRFVAASSLILRTKWYAWILVWLLCVTEVANAQAIGSFVSPGPLARPHDSLSGLTGCTNCHTPGQGPTPDRCMKCHDAVREQVQSRTGFHRNRGTSCGDCHPDHRGLDYALVPDLTNDPKFNHAVDAGWPLEGAHFKLRCLSCHESPRRYVGLDKACATCHDDPHGRTQTTRTLLQDCETCHDARDWVANAIPLERFDHDDPQDADYPLDGEHANVACTDCHAEARFVGLAFGACTDCHAKNTHRASAIVAKKCESCHPTPATWEVPTFDHNWTRYPLVGGHVGVDCESCHPGDKTEPIQFEKCDTCHTDVHRGQFAPRGCDECHTVQRTDWKIPQFNHDATRFPLVGQHQEQTCEACHGTGPAAKYAKLPHADCDDCHDDAHNGRFQPTNCAACHTPEGFDVQFFDHDQTKFPHTGKHIGVACDLCHVPGKWNGVPHGSCNDCHREQNPHGPEIRAGDCEGCHTTEGFALVRFDHVAETGFDLFPQHSDLPCSECHADLRSFVGLLPDCLECHGEDEPKGHYPGACETCHTASRWWPAGLGDLDHSATGFALHGAHSLEPCEACHASGEPRGQADPACVSCHRRDDAHYGMLGDACGDCHTEMAWLRTSWRHLTTGWALRGAHRLAACVDCHAAGYIGTPTECFRCHENQAVCGGADAIRCEQAHASPQFPECDSCHVVYTWTVGTDRFPH